MESRRLIITNLNSGTGGKASTWYEIGDIYEIIHIDSKYYYQVVNYDGKQRTILKMHCQYYRPDKIDRLLKSL